MVEGNLSNLIFGAEMPDSPVYFKLCSPPEASNNQRHAERHDAKLDVIFGDVTSAFCVLISRVSGESRTSYSQREAEFLHKLQEALNNDGSQKYETVSLHAHTETGHFEWGHMVMMSSEQKSEKVMNTNEVSWPAWTYRFIESLSSSQSRQNGFVRLKAMHIYRKQDEIRCREVPSGEEWGITSWARPECHPAFLAPENNSLFTSLDQVMDVLHQCSNIPEVEELKAIAESELREDLPIPPARVQPFIVIEGLDGTGKSTLARTLAKRLAAKQLYSPPPVLHPLRKKFDSLSPLLRRTFYSLGNYLVARQVALHSQTRPVVMDRFWHSTAAYTIATECASGDETVLPPVGHNVYEWPRDLIMPSAVLLLKVPEQVRETRLCRRLARDQEEKTAEEQHISQDILFKRRILVAYNRMRDPAVFSLQAEGTPEQLVEASLEVLTKAGINFLPT